jgi:hypothetical protein
MQFLRHALMSFAVAGLLAVPALALPITLYNTGVTAPNNPDGTNATVITTGGTNDAHYTVTLPSGVGPAPAKVVTDQGAYFRPGNSQYVNPFGTANGNDPVGGYVYRTTFDLTGLNPATATISGTVYVDNSVTVLLNGQGTGNIGGSFTAGTQLDFTIPVGTAAFQPGVNILDFLVDNAGGTPNPEALDVTLLRGTANAVPEPGAACVLAIAAGAGLVGRRTSRRHGRPAA